MYSQGKSKSVEVKSIDNPIRTAAGIGDPIKETIIKIKKRETAQIPITGQKELVIYLKVDVGVTTVFKKKRYPSEPDKIRHKETREADGTVTISYPRMNAPPHIASKKNIFTDFTEHPNNELKTSKLLDAIIIRDKTGRFIASYKKTGGDWTRE